MTGERAADQISAYFDGELSAEELTEVEAKLKDTTEAQRELRDIQALSQLIHQLPRYRAPQEFQAHVMQQAERRMLLTGDREAADVSTRRRLLRIPGLAAVLATAAVLFLAVMLVNPGAERQNDQFTGSPLQSARNESGPTSEDEIVAARSASRGGVGSPGDDVEADAAAASVPAESLSAPAAKPHAPLHAESSRVSVALGDAEGGHSRFRVDVEKLRKAEVGQVIRALEHSSDGIGVVWLTVLDRRQGLTDLQVLLKRFKIPPDTSAQQTTAEQDAPAENASSELVAVYVEATGNQLASALEAMRASEQFQQLEVDEPIALASLDERSQSQLIGQSTMRGLADSRSAEPLRQLGVAGHRKAEAAKTTPSEPNAEPADAAKHAEQETDSAERRELATSDQLGRKSPTRDAQPASAMARQMQISLPSGVLRAASRQAADVDNRRGRDNAAIGKAAGGRTNDGGPALSAVTDSEKESIRRRSLQVLFVVVNGNGDIDKAPDGPVLVPPSSGRDPSDSNPDNSDRGAA